MDPYETERRNTVPIYEYTCNSCGNEFDKLRPVTRMDDAAPCPGCEGDSSRRLSVFAVYSSGSDGETAAVLGGGGGCGGCGPGGCACSMSV